MSSLTGYLKRQTILVCLFNLSIIEHTYVHIMGNRIEAKEKSRKGIQDTALLLFGKYGYHGTSIRMIAKESGVSLGLMYNYFDGKEGLIRSIFDTNYTELKAVLTLRTSAGDNDFEKLLERIFVSIEESRSFWRLYYSIKMQITLNDLLVNDLLKIQKLLITEVELVLKPYKLSNLTGESMLLYSAIDGVIQNYLSNPEFPKQKILDLIIFKYSKLNKAVS